MDGLTLLSQRDNIEEAFKSLIKSGRPDIRDDENKNLLPRQTVNSCCASERCWVKAIWRSKIKILLF